MLFIGTMHYDLEGKSKLERVLTQYSDCRIALEAPCNYFRQDLRFIVTEYRKTMECGLAKINHPQIKEVGKLLMENKYYEWTVPLQLKQKNNLELVFFDDLQPYKREAPVRAAIEDIHEISDILSFTFFQDADPVQRYQLYKKAFHRAYKEAFTAFEEAHGRQGYVCRLDDKREERLAQRLEAQQPDIVICGISHIIPLHVSSPEDVLLYERIVKVDKSFFDLVPFSAETVIPHATKDNHP